MKIIPNRNLFGSIESYTVREETDVEKAEDRAAGTVAQWWLYGFLGLFLLPFIPMVLALSPIWYFVTRHMLKKEKEKNTPDTSKKVKFLKIANKITLVVFIWLIVSWTIILVCGSIFLLYYFGMIDIPILDQMIEAFL